MSAHEEHEERQHKCHEQRSAVAWCGDCLAKLRRIERESAARRCAEIAANQAVGYPSDSLHGMACANIYAAIRSAFGLGEEAGDDA